MEDYTVVIYGYIAFVRRLGTLLAVPPPFVRRQTQFPGYPPSYNVPWPMNIRTLTQL